MRRFPFGALELVPHPLAKAGCRGWCAEREAPYANSLPGAGACSRVSKKLEWGFCSTRVGNPARRDEDVRGTTQESRERAGVRGFPFGALELVQRPLVGQDVVAGATKGKPRMPARCRTWQICSMKVSAPARRALTWKEQRRVSGKSSFTALPFRRVGARPTPSRTAGCGGWCAEREAQYANSLPGACACSSVSRKLEWGFCSMRGRGPYARLFSGSC